MHNYCGCDLRPSITRADHATPTEHITYAQGAVSPVLTPHPAFNRVLGGLVNPVSTAFCLQALALWSDHQNGTLNARRQLLV